MPGSYETEVKAFRTVFEPLKDKKIVLYGIGRYTATLVPEIPDYHLIGFMDRDPENIGKVIYGLPVLGRDQVEKEADLIIINTVEAYWNTIYARIQDISVPVFYRNGKRAKMPQMQFEDLEYWNQSWTELREKAERCEVISFDIFDTLIARAVYMSKDIWGFIEISLETKRKKKTNFRQLREQANSLAGPNGTLDEIYKMLGQLSGWSRDEITEAKKEELALEQRLAVPRRRMVHFCKELMASGKEVYFISDMYLPAEWFQEILARCGILCKKEQILISSDKKADKKSGSLWGLYETEFLKGRNALHIGDDKWSDIDNAHKIGLETGYAMAGRDLLSISSVREAAPHICSQMASRTMGLIIQKVMNDPFVLNPTRGMIRFEDPETFGYCVFGPVIHTFLIWLIQQANKDRIQKLFFVSRDGYFLQEDYDFLIQDAVQDKMPCPEGRYLLTSRLVALEAGIQDEEGLKEVMRFPFTGRLKDYMEVRFGLELPEEDLDQEIHLPGDEEEILKKTEPYRDQIMKIISEKRKQYLGYLDSCDIGENAAVVDTWYYGHTQYYLNRLLKEKVSGYYFAANLSEANQCAAGNRMIPCFQSEKDWKAEQCQLFKKALITESFLTAPYGMIQEVDANGSFRCSEERENQKNFGVKQKINEGVKRFIHDFWKGLPELAITKMEPDPQFADMLFGYWFHEGCELGGMIKDSFWSDNELVQKREFRIFE